MKNNTAECTAIGLYSYLEVSILSSTSKAIYYFSSISLEISLLYYKTFTPSSSSKILSALFKTSKILASNSSNY